MCFVQSGFRLTQQSGPSDPVRCPAGGRFGSGRPCDLLTFFFFLVGGGFETLSGV